jgi:hypothetical protein
MILDIPATISAADPIIDGWCILPPELPHRPLWRTLVHLRGDADDNFTSSLTPFVVGAYGHSRTDSVVRGFGEAIERAALFAGDDIYDAPVPPRLLQAARPHIALAAPGANGDWTMGMTVSGAQEVAIPVALVNYPCLASGFDPSPSGAASGIGRGAALRSAVLEIIERDAFLLAWNVGAAVPRIDLTLLPAPTSLSAQRARLALLRLLDTVSMTNVTIELAELPVAAEGVLCAVAVAIERCEEVVTRVAVGCNAKDDPWTAALGAVQEALQVHSLQVDLNLGADNVARDDVVDENSRLRRLASVDGVTDVLDWVASFDAPRCRKFAETTTNLLVESVECEGAELMYVDLTSRLPKALIDLGWAVVKVIPVGMQGFRLDERPTWSWNEPRRRTVVNRWIAKGIGVSRPTGGGPPHPLP